MHWPTLKWVVIIIVVAFIVYHFVIAKPHADTSKVL